MKIHRIQEPRKYSVALCSLGVVGLITSDSKEKVIYNDGSGLSWIGVVLEDISINDIGKTIHVKKFDKWSSKYPKVLFQMNESDLFSGYQDGINFNNVIRKLVDFRNKKLEFNEIIENVDDFSEFNDKMNNIGDCSFIETLKQNEELNKLLLQIKKRNISLNNF